MPCFFQPGLLCTVLSFLEAFLKDLKDVSLSSKGCVRQMEKLMQELECCIQSYPEVYSRKFQTHRLLKDQAGRLPHILNHLSDYAIQCKTRDKNRKKFSNFLAYTLEISQVWIKLLQGLFISKFFTVFI